MNGGKGKGEKGNGGSEDSGNDGGGEWLRHGEGRRPRVSWSISMEAPLVALQLARETGEVLAADAIGGRLRYC